MRSKRLWYRVLALAALCILSSVSGIAAEKVYINGIDANFPPFAYVDKSGNPDGFDVKALGWIAKEMGFKVKHQPMDWDGIIPSLEAKTKAGRVTEDEHNSPHTMYGANKLYCEKLGEYYGNYYGQRHLDPQPPVMLDFRCLRFPGLVSAYTLPSGGTSDYGPEMLHAAAKGVAYSCFVREDVQIPFMSMPDAVTALLRLTEAPRQALTRLVYNVTSFSLSAAEFRQWVLKFFPDAQIAFDPDDKRQGIVDSWPADLDDSPARRDWGWVPDYDLERSFSEYLVPNITNRYKKLRVEG